MVCGFTHDIAEGYFLTFDVFRVLGVSRLIYGNQLSVPGTYKIRPGRPHHIRAAPMHVQLKAIAHDWEKREGLRKFVKPDHSELRAVVCVRHWTPQQVITNQESLELEYALSQRARELGWREADINVIDSDLGRSGTGALHTKELRIWSRASFLRKGSLINCRIVAYAFSIYVWSPPPKQRPPLSIDLNMYGTPRCSN